MFLHWYFVAFTGESPFGFSGALDMKTIYQQKARVTLDEAGRDDLPPELRVIRAHTHNARDDAIEQAEIFNSSSPGREVPMKFCDKQLAATSRASSRCPATSATSTARRSTACSRSSTRSCTPTAPTRSRVPPRRLAREGHEQPPARRQAGRRRRRRLLRRRRPGDFDIADLQQLIKKLLGAAYPQKSEDDFEEPAGAPSASSSREPALEVDLVPIVALDDDANYGLQYSRTGDCVKTSVKAHIDHYRDHAGRDPLLAPRFGWPSAGATGRSLTASSRSTSS